MNLQSNSTPLSLAARPIDPAVSPPDDDDPAAPMETAASAAPRSVVFQDRISLETRAFGSVLLAMSFGLVVWLVINAPEGLALFNA